MAVTERIEIVTNMPNMKMMKDKEKLDHDEERNTNDRESGLELSQWNDKSDENSVQERLDDEDEDSILGQSMQASDPWQGLIGWQYVTYRIAAVKITD